MQNSFSNQTARGATPTLIHFGDKNLNQLSRLEIFPGAGNNLAGVWFV
jgi:hypothetical protein